MSETVYQQGTLVNSQTNVTVNGYILMDQTDRGPYLAPSTANATVIQQWIQKTVNSCGQPFWSNIVTYNAISITWPAGSDKVYGTVLLPDGRIIFPPGASGTYIGIFNPFTNTFSSVSAASGYWGGVLARDGRVIFIPNNATNVGTFNPVTGVYTTYAFTGIAGVTIPGGSSAYIGGVISPDGRVIFCPNNATHVGTFNPGTNTFVTYAAGVGGPQGMNAYFGATLVTDGRVVFSPGNAANVGVFNPVTNSFTTYTGGTLPPGTNAHYGGILVPDGRVIFPPSNTPNVGIFNPMTNAYSSVSVSSIIASPGLNIIGGCLLPNGKVLFASRSSVAIYTFDPTTNIFASTGMIGTSNSTSACLLRDGRIVFSPQNDTTLAVIQGGTPVSAEFCLHPFFNKY